MVIPAPFRGTVPLSLENEVAAPLGAEARCTDAPIEQVCLQKCPTTIQVSLSSRSTPLLCSECEDTLTPHETKLLSLTSHCFFLLCKLECVVLCL